MMALTAVIPGVMIAVMTVLAVTDVVAAVLLLGLAVAEDVAGAVLPPGWM
jgi:hypothetical protein